MSNTIRVYKLIAFSRQQTYIYDSCLTPTCGYIFYAFTLIADDIFYAFTLIADDIHVPIKQIQLKKLSL